MCLCRLQPLSHTPNHDWRPSGIMPGGARPTVSGRDPQSHRGSFRPRQELPDRTLGTDHS
ncbi:hypothetical protein INR49_012890 [Caranx melampygus]|nr:hypothetical protein INR49_012890 [Caranx melampygus]